MKSYNILILTILLTSAISLNAQYVLFKDTLPQGRTIFLAEKNTELYFDIARSFDNDFIMTYKPDLLTNKPLGMPFGSRVGIVGGILNSKIALGGLVSVPLCQPSNNKRFGIKTTEGLNATTVFILTSGKTEIYIIPGVEYSIHVYDYLKKYIIVNPGLSLWLGTTCYPVITLNIGVGL